MKRVLYLFGELRVSVFRALQGFAFTVFKILVLHTKQKSKRKPVTF